MDEAPGVRTALAHSLRQAGLFVATAADAPEALAAFASRAFDLVIAEDELPGDSGIDLLARLRRLHPGTLRVLITGRRDFGRMRQAINRAGICFFLSKPWDAQSLRELVEGLLPSGVRTPARGDSSMPPSWRAQRLIAALGRCGDGLEIAGAVAREFGRLAGLDEIWWVDEDVHTLRRLHADGSVEDEVFLDCVDAATFRVLEAARCVTRPRLFDSPEGEGAWLALPIWHRGRSLALFCVRAQRRELLMGAPFALAEHASDGIAAALASWRERKPRVEWWNESEDADPVRPGVVTG